MVQFVLGWSLCGYFVVTFSLGWSLWFLGWSLCGYFFFRMVIFGFGSGHCMVTLWSFSAWYGHGCGYFMVTLWLFVWLLCGYVCYCVCGYCMVTLWLLFPPLTLSKYRIHQPASPQQ